MRIFNYMKKFFNIIVWLLALYATIGMLTSIFSFSYVKKVEDVDYKWTGNDLLVAVNQYRVSQGLSILELDPILCDNLVERWLAIKDPNNGHKGNEEWLKEEGIMGNPRYGMFAEMYITGAKTTNAAIQWWIGSPGHKVTLETKEMKYGCTYANEGTGILIMATEN